MYGGRQLEGKATRPINGMNDVTGIIKDSVRHYATYDNRSGLPGGRYVITYPVSPQNWPDDDPYCGGIGQIDCDDPDYVPRDG